MSKCCGMFPQLVTVKSVFMKHHFKTFFYRCRKCGKSAEAGAELVDGVMKPTGFVSISAAAEAWEKLNNGGKK